MSAVDVVTVVHSKIIIKADSLRMFIELLISSKLYLSGLHSHQPLPAVE